MHLLAYYEAKAIKKILLCDRSELSTMHAPELRTTLSFYISSTAIFIQKHFMNTNIFAYEPSAYEYNCRTSLGNHMFSKQTIHLALVKEKSFLRGSNDSKYCFKKCKNFF